MPRLADTIKPDKPSATGSDGNSASLPEGRGANSRASSWQSSRTDGSWRRERQSAGSQTSVLPGPVPHGKSTRNVVYYQNRFLVIDSTPASVDFPTGAHRVTSAVTPNSGGGASGSAVQVAGEADVRSKRKATNVAAVSGRQMASTNSAAACNADAAAGAAAISTSDHGRVVTSQRSKRILEMDPCSVTVDGRGIEIIVSDETGISHRPDTPSRLSGKRALLKRVGTVLLDNRMTGKENFQNLLIEHPEEYRVLKRVLNIIFVTVGMALLVSVFVVIVYTAVGECLCPDT